MKLSELKMLVESMINQHGDVRLWKFDRETNGMLQYKESDVEFELMHTPEAGETVLEVNVR